MLAQVAQISGVLILGFTSQLDVVKGNVLYLAWGGVGRGHWL